MNRTQEQGITSNNPDKPQRVSGHAMTKNWVRWLFGAVFLLALGIFVFQAFQTQIAIQNGEPPVKAFHDSQQKVWHVLLNPWFFAGYLLILIVLLSNAVRTIVKKQRERNDLWVAAALLVTIAVLVFRFIERH